MPEVIHTDMKKLLLELFNKQSSALTTVYMGLRTDTPAVSDTLSTVNGNEVGGTSAAGYARISLTVNNTNFPDSSTGNDWQIAIPQQSFAAFTGTPNPNGGTHWFLTDQSTGYTGKLLASGPLNPSTVSSTLQALADSGQAVIAVTNAIAAELNVGDWLFVGTTTNNAAAGDIERGKIQSIGAAGSGGTGLTNITLTANLANNHANGEPVSRDGMTRTYASGQVEQVTATLSLISVSEAFGLTN